VIFNRSKTDEDGGYARYGLVKGVVIFTEKKQARRRRKEANIVCGGRPQTDVKCPIKNSIMAIELAGWLVERTAR